MSLSNSQILSSVVTMIVVTAGATSVAAQSRSHRTEISANVGALTGTSTFKESQSFSSNGNETATLTADHRTKTAIPFSVGGAARIVRHFWVGVQYAMAEIKPSASISAVIPHPLLFNAPRTVQGSIDNVAHKERNVHVHMMYALPLGAIDVKVMGGPTFFNVKQDFVANVALTESYPFDTATFASATKKQLSKSAVGFNAGVDISYPLSSNVGVGTLIRYSRADVKFDDSDSGQHSVRGGGVEAGAGIRFRF